MVSAGKRLSSTSLKKAQAEITSFTRKSIDSKNSLSHSYAQPVLDNPYEVLLDPDNEDEVMDDAESNTGNVTPKKDNMQVSQSSNSENAEAYQPLLSKKMQRKTAKASKTGSKLPKGPQENFLSLATKATLGRARKAKEDVTEESSKEDDTMDDH
jgi:hypothetical protein